MTADEAKPRDDRIDETLEEQVKLLSERAKRSNDGDLPRITNAMLEIAKYLRYGMY